MNARSPMRLLEKGLHGGLGAGNLGFVLAGHGVGKTPFLVCVALDELLRGGHVLHVSMEGTVPHIRASYDAVFEDLAASTHLDQEVVVHAELDRRRSIRVYPPHSLTSSKLREAVKLETENGSRPTVVIIEGIDFDALDREDLVDLKALAEELPAEVWLPVSCPDERAVTVPESIGRLGDIVSVLLALEPDGNSVRLRALKDHDNPDVAELHVALDPRTLLLVRT